MSAPDCGRRTRWRGRQADWVAGQAGRPGGLRTGKADRVREVDLMVEDQTMEAGVLIHGH
jgi:hypothetical protein